MATVLVSVNRSSREGTFAMSSIRPGTSKGGVPSPCAATAGSQASRLHSRVRGAIVIGRVIKIEPVVRIEAAIMFQAADVLLDPGTQGFRPLGAIQMDALRQRLKVNVILPPPLVEAKKQDDGHLQESGQQKRSF